MRRGPQSKKLSFEQIEQLRKIQMRVEGRSLLRLRDHMKAPFGWQTLSTALKGRPIWLPNYQFITEWLNGQTIEAEVGSSKSRPPKVPAVRGRA